MNNQSSTNNFKTKTTFLKRNNIKPSNSWVIGLDIGYSSVKAFSPNSVMRFPSYATRVKENFGFAGSAPWNSILYRNYETNEYWLVGEVAQNIMSDTDTSDSEASLYGRERYSTAIFKVLSDVGLGLSYLTEENLSFICKKADNNEPILSPTADESIIIQTGLPEKYMDDEDELIDSLTGNHKFGLKIGQSDWITFNISINKENVYIMSQPKGTLFSICTKNDGNYVDNALDYLHSSIIVFDAGFGTLDIFPIKAGTVKEGETYSDLGMKRVLQETSAELKKKYKANVPVPSMQKHLDSGTVTIFDKKTLSSTNEDFSDILFNKSKIICDEAIERLMSVLNLAEYSYIIVTGGTGAAWYNQIVEKFKNAGTLTILKGNENDTLPFVFANARGYYLYRTIKTKA